MVHTPTSIGFYPKTVTHEPQGRVTDGLHPNEVTDTLRILYGPKSMAFYPETLHACNPNRKLTETPPDGRCDTANPPTCSPLVILSQALGTPQTATVT